MSSDLIGRQLLTLLAGLGVLAAVVAAPSHATFAGQDGLLAYQAAVGGHTELFTIKPDGTGRRQVTHWTDSDSTNAEWSPDGRTILFTRSWMKPHPRTLMYTMNADGSRLQAVNAPLRFSAIWLPDGRHLLGIRALRFVIVNADGSGIRDAGIPGVPGQPCFLGTGGRFAELTSRSDGESAIFIGRIGGGNGSLKRITPWKGMNNIACSPDGSEIAFNSPSDDSPQSANVFTVKSDGSGERQLTHAVGGKTDNIPDSWSPDGRKLAFISNKTGAFEVYSMDADGARVTQITHGPEAHLASWGSHP